MEDAIYESPHVTPRTVTVTMPDGTFADGRPRVRVVYINFMSHGERGNRPEQTDPQPAITWAKNVEHSVSGQKGASVGIIYADGHKEITQA